MQIPIEQVVEWSARVQGLLGTPRNTDGEGLSLADVAGMIGGLYTQLNHIPYFSLMARRESFTAKQLLQDQCSGAPALVRMPGPRSGFLMGPCAWAPVMSVVAHSVRDKEVKERVRPLQTDELRTIVQWIHTRLLDRPMTYPELREGAPPEALRPIERGTERALHQEPALRQVLAALEIRGEVASTLDGGLNASEGPFRYHLRSRIAPRKCGSKEEAADILAEWYMMAFAPASARDFAVWSGLSGPVARRALGAVQAPMRSLDVAGMDDELLLPESMLSWPAMTEPACFVIPWLDHWFMGYRTPYRFLPDGPGGPVSDRDLVLVSLGPGMEAARSIAGRIRVVGDARSPRFEPDPWRPLAVHERAALERAMEKAQNLFSSKSV